MGLMILALLSIISGMYIAAIVLFIIAIAVNDEPHRN